MKIRSRVGVIVLVDILAVLVLLLASRLSSVEMEIELSTNQQVAIEAEVTIVSQTEDSQFEYLTLGGWREFDGSEKWLNQMITLDCKKICDNFIRSDHVKSEMLVVGGLASKLIFTHYNECRKNREVCGSQIYLIEKSDFVIIQR